MEDLESGNNEMNTPLLEHSECKTNGELNDIKSCKECDDSKLKKKELSGGGVRRLLVMAKSERKSLVIGCIVLLIRLPFSLSIPHLIARIIGALTKDDYTIVKESITLLILFGTIDALLDFWCVYLFGRAKEKIIRKIRMDTFKSTLGQELAYFDDTTSGELVSRLTNDCSCMAGNLTWCFRFSIEAFVRVMAISIYMTMRCPVLAYCTLVVIPLIAFVNKKYGDWLGRNARDSQQSLAESSSVAQEALQNIRTVFSFAAEQSEISKYRKKVDLNYNLQIKQVIASGIYYMVISTFLINTCLQAAILSIGAYMISQHELTPEILLAFMLYQGQLQQYTKQLFDSYSSLMTSSGSGDKVFQMLDRKPNLPGTGLIGKMNTDSNDTPPLSTEINFKNVHFTYPSRPSHPVLRNINFNIPAGSTVALVGPSGCGKSTIVSLLERFYDPDNGSIELQGVDLRHKDITEYRRHCVAIVSQEPSLFSGTILENILYGCSSTMSSSEAIHASKMANAHNFIQSFPDNYNTQVGEHGLQLSGGQKQRIAIARAIVKKPTLLLLDEATSALDTESEKVVQKALDNLLNIHKQMTTVIVAHRLQTVRNADSIVVMQPINSNFSPKQGNILEIGSHEQLMLKEHGFYRQMVITAEHSQSPTFQ